MYHDSLLYNNSYASSVTNDKVIFGTANANGSDMSLGFIWDEQHGMRYIKDVLEQEYGYDFGDDVLTNASSWNPAGTIIQGNGYTSSGEEFFWKATIPEPCTVMLLGMGGLLLRRKLEFRI